MAAVVNTNDFMTFFRQSSPFVLPISIVLYSAAQESFAGLWYIIFLTIFTLMRMKLVQSLFESKLASIANNCVINLFGKDFAPGLFIAFFTLIYICLPMITSKIYTPVIFSIIIVYALMNLFINWDCYKNNTAILLCDFILSIIFAVGSIVIIMAIDKSLLTFNATQNFLFINVARSNTETCGLAQNQNFRCLVYKNGQLVKGLPTTSGVPGAN